MVYLPLDSQSLITVLTGPVIE